MSEGNADRFAPCTCELCDCPKCDGRGYSSIKEERCSWCVDGIITPLKKAENEKREKLIQ